MRRVKPKLLLVIASCVLSLFVSVRLTAGEQKQLSPQDQKVIDYLVSDWSHDTVTSVDIAMTTLKVEPSEETRFRLGSHIKAHPELHEVIRRWGWVTLVLTPEEKLIARALINAQRDGKPSPSVSEIAKAVGITEAQTKRELAMLERYEILKQDNKTAGAGYSILPQYVKWEPRLDFLFHKVTLDSGRQFNTN